MTVVSYVTKTAEYDGAGEKSYMPNNFPAGTVQTGDLLLLQITWKNHIADRPIPTMVQDPTTQGWISLSVRSLMDPISGVSWKTAVYYRFAGSETGADRPTFVFNEETQVEIIVTAFRGVSISKPLSYGSNGTSERVSSVTLNQINYSAFAGTALEVCAWAQALDSYTTSGLSGFTKRFDTANERHRMYTAPISSSASGGTASTRTFTLTDTSPYQAWHIVLYPANNPPTLTLTSPSNNQTLSEGNALPIQGTAGDTDNGNVVTVKFKINGGTARAIASGVSDGSSPISFSKALNYSNKRLWDGSTDVAGVDLAEGVDHTLTVWAEDDQGGKSAEITRKFRVIWNRPPVISGANEDLGTIMVPPSKAYTVTEPEGNPFTITEKINGNVIRSFEGVAGREETVTIPHDLWIRLDLDTPHSLTVEATDSKGLTSTRTFTFTRKETHIEFMLDFDNPDVEAHFTLDGMPKRVLVTLERYLPPGSQIEFVRVCNNAMDEVPTWEDATAAVTAGRGYLFTNQEKTAENWRINIWVCIAKGTATERVRLDGFGGAFD
jgi:hypothetical protein